MDGTEPEFNPVMDADEPLQPFDVHSSSERAGLMKLLLGFGLLLALAFIVMKLYQPGTRARTDPPLITAENTPFKVVPEDVGGMQTPDQDKEVFEVMSGEAPSTDVVTLPSPEVPITLPTPTTQEPASEPIAPEPDPVPITPSTAERPPQRPPVMRVDPGPPASETTPTPAPARPAPAPATGGSDWVVQVASLRTQAEANATYADIAAKQARVLSGYGSDIRRVDLAEKGIYYRVRIAGFASKADASATCSQLKAGGQACFVTKR